MNDTNRLYELLLAGQDEMPADMKRVTLRYALYVRKSTTSEDRQASSIEDQIRECLDKVVSPQNLNIVKVYKESYSAKIADMRAEFNSMIREIENHRIDGLIAWHPDRLSRNMKEAGTIIDLVDRGLIRDIQFPTFTFENTPAGKMLLGITFVMAKQYSEHLAESVDRGNKRATDDGEFIGKYKHGYIVDDNRVLQPDPHNFTKVKHMFNMAISGASQKSIREWINQQGYTVQKRPGGAYRPHQWSKDDVSKLLHDPLYAGVMRWGKSLVDLVKRSDFEPVISVVDFLKINRIDSLHSTKFLSIQSPRSGDIKADLLRGVVYCGSCNRTLTSMLMPKRNQETKEIIETRYYYKCETEGCPLEGKSIRAGVALRAALQFFEKYLFVTKSNYDEYTRRAQNAIKQKLSNFESVAASAKANIANKEKSYEKTKELLINNPDLKDHYDLAKSLKDIELLKADFKRAKYQKDNIKEALPTFKEYLKLLESTPVILSKIHDMKTMDQLLRIFFSNFTVTPTNESSFKGSNVSYKLNEPWRGFVENGDFVLGAGGPKTFTPN